MSKVQNTKIISCYSVVRHAIFDGSTNIPDFADAMFMHVSCSAFINYLLLKASGYLDHLLKMLSMSKSDIAKEANRQVSHKG